MHQIGNDDAATANSAMATVVLFMVSFSIVFFVISSFIGFPSLSTEFWTFRSTMNLQTFPFFQTILTISVLPTFLGGGFGTVGGLLVFSEVNDNDDRLLLLLLLLLL